MRDHRLEIELDRVAGDSKVTIYIGRDEIKVEYSGLLSERFFERLVIGHDYRHVPYIVSRICGVCSHAHFWASNLAIENALGIEVDEATANLRDVCNKLQIIENHVVHLVFLAMPDYKIPDQTTTLSAIRARDSIKKAIGILCGRLTGPQPYMPGGFTNKITSLDVEKVIKLVIEASHLIDLIIDKFMSIIHLPFIRDHNNNYIALSTWPVKSIPIKKPYVLLSNDNELVINEENYLDYFYELKPGYSNSKTCLLNKKVFFVGARARLLATKYIEINSELFELISNNPYSNLVAKALETRYLLGNVISTLEELCNRKPRRTRGNPKKGSGLSVVEAPRGLLIHYYDINEDGKVSRANIITPTVLFSKHLEKSIETVVSQLDLFRSDLNKATRYIEMLVRSYDPCIPCAVHIIKA
ncbi:MAG: nickel-dependent hydrogenase large subunit [Desulfurococcaceae archaeon]